MRNSRLFYLAIAGGVLLVASSVFATEGRGTEASYAERVLAFKTQPDASELKGSLICQMAEQNTGAPCDIRLKEWNTGVVFRLENSTAARRLFNDGIREVALTGDRLGETVFSITTAKAR